MRPTCLSGIVLLLAPLWPVSAAVLRAAELPFRFDAPAGPQFTDEHSLEFRDLQRDDAHPFTIDATGATFWFDLPDDQAPTCHFCVGFMDCRNITLRGATIDRATRGHVEGRITHIDFAGNRLELQLSPGITVPTAFNDKLEQRVVPFQADGSFCVPLYALQRGGVHLKYKDISPADADGRCWVTMQTRRLLDTIRATGVLGVGDGLSCVYTVTSSIELVHSAQLTMDGLRTDAAKAWGAERGGDGGHVWKNCYQRLLIQSGPGTVRNCRFTRWGSAIELNSVFPYVEGGVPRGIRIENNVLTDVGVTVYTHTFQRDKAPEFHDITITGNTFNWPAQRAIALEHAAGAVIASNTLAGRSSCVPAARTSTWPSRTKASRLAAG